MDIPWITTEQMIEVDRAMMEDARILLIQMMENAGRNLAALTRQRFLGGDPRGQHVVVMAGTGGNGGGGMVAARRLHAWGAKVVVVVTDPAGKLPDVPAHQLDILRRMGVKILSGATMQDLGTPNAILDAVIGYSLRGTPRGPAAVMLDWANDTHAPILSLDVPSGIETTTGTIFDHAIRAAATMTLALPKQGLLALGVDRHLGELYVADISVPPELYAEEGLGLKVGPLFAQEDIVRLWLPGQREDAQSVDGTPSETKV